MASLERNIKQAIADFNSIKQAIEESGVPVPYDTDTKEYGDLVREAVASGKGVVNADTHYDFPSVGSTEMIYKAQTEKLIYQWNPTELKYEVLGTAVEIDVSNVYFADDLTTTAAVGNISLTNGQATIAAAGKNLKDVWNKIFVQEKNPTITQPSVSLTFGQAKAYEVGTSVTPSYSATLNAGIYQFGGATGITATAWSVTDTASHTSTKASGSFAAVTVSDSTNYKITATATYGDGTIPKTNVGNNYAAGQIKAGTKSATSGAITGYRNSFYGTMEEKTTVNSAAIRALSGKSNKALANGNTFTVSVPVGALRVVIAYPATLRDVTSIKDVNGLNAEIKSGFTKSTVSVEGANGSTAIDYKVYTLDFASANDKANTYTVQI